MKLYDFTEPELAFYKAFCNFTEAEETLFGLRKRGIPLERCAEIMRYENVKPLSRKVNRKIIKVTNSVLMDKWIADVYWKSLQSCHADDIKAQNTMEGSKDGRD